MEGSFWSLLWTSLLALYALPSLIAFYRKADSAWSILTLNLLFGWTLVMWFGASIWAMTDKSTQPRGA